MIVWLVYQWWFPDPKPVQWVRSITENTGLQKSHTYCCIIPKDRTVLKMENIKTINQGLKWSLAKVAEILINIIIIININTMANYRDNADLPPQAYGIVRESRGNARSQVSTGYFGCIIGHS